jgi:hypothetical protein
MRDDSIWFAIPAFVIVRAMNLYSYTTTKNKTSLVAGVLLFLSGMGLLALTLF